MNAQAKYETGMLTSLGIEWTHIFGKGSGYTANPMRGCQHKCRWKIGDKIIICYAEAFRDRMDGPGAFQKLTWHPAVLEEIEGKVVSSGVFIGSMADALGQGVGDEKIEALIKTMKKCKQHLFFILTKNPVRLRRFIWPDNAIVGISSPADFMFEKPLTPEQQHQWFKTGLTWLKDTKAKTKWVSLEPLTADIPGVFEEVGFKPDWAVIGAGSDGSKTFQPDEALVRRTLDALKGVPIFYKGNMSKALMAKMGGERYEFPKMDSRCHSCQQPIPEGATSCAHCLSTDADES